MAVQAAPLVGRDRELASLEDGLAAAADGSPGMVVVAGDAGVGKTRFVREVMDRAVEDGWTVLSGACVELSEGAAVLAPVAEVLRQLARDRGDEAVVSLLDGPARWLAPLVPELDCVVDGEGEAPVTQVLVSFHRLLRDVADEGSVLLVVEDLHWADATTRDLLRHLASRFYDERLLVVATVRTDDLDRRHPLRPVLAEVVHRPEVDRIDLGPLDDDVLVEHLRGLAGDDVGQDDLVAVVRRAGGNPFHAEELLAAGSDRLPPSLHDTLRLRLDRLPIETQQLLGEAAVLGATVDARLLSSVTVLGRAAVPAALRAALDDGVLVVDGDGYAFRHALLREVALERLLPDERVRAHAAAAAALEADPNQAVAGRAGARGQAAHHWWEARDLPRCLAASVAAADAADRVFASGVALRHRERAMELWGQVEDPEQITGTTRPALLVAAARAAEEAADPRATELGMAAVRAADAAGDDDARAAAVAKLFITLLNDGRYGDALGLTAEELGRHREDDRTARRSLALSSKAMAVTWVGELRAKPWDLDAVTADLDEALEIARECGDWFAEYRALSGIAQVLGAYLPGRLDEAMEQLLVLARRPEAKATRHVIHFFGLMVQLMAGDIAGAEETLQRWRAIEDEAGKPPRRSRILSTVGSIWVDSMFGRHGAIGPAVDSVDLRDLEVTESALALVAASGDWLRWTGHAARALDRAEYVAATSSDDAPDGELAGELVASLAATGASIDDVAEIVRQANLEVTSRSAAFVVTRLVVATAAAAGDQAIDDDLLAHLDDLIEQVADYIEWTPRDAPVRPWWESVLLWARAERAHLAGTPDPALWDPVVATLDERGYLPYAAATRLRRAVARAAADGGSSQACEDDLLAAWDVFTDLGLTALQDDAATLARRLRIALPDRTDGSDTDEEADTALPDLTGREREVLSLVAEGWTNKRVGEHLFISPKTVSVHMSNAMRKLDVDSRTEAVAVAHRAGLLTDE
jgi:DNA-binding CsgD family transcriptional regulator/tetratricopeptide (TPR) repeat protein